MTLYMELSEDRTAVIGLPRIRPLRADLVIDGSAYTHADVSTLTDEQLADWAGFVALDGAAEFDPAEHLATGGGALSAAGLALPDFEVRPVTVDAIRVEAERRISAGLTVNGAAFRTDDVSTARVDQMARAFAGGASEGADFKFKTESGMTVTIATSEQAAALYQAMIMYRASILSRSAELQDTLPDDFADDANWPPVPAVDL